MAYFDEAYPDATYRAKILKLFPEEFSKGYKLYRERKLKAEQEYYPDENTGWHENTRWRSKTSYGWYTLTPGMAIKFNLNGSDIPILYSVIPNLIDLDGT